MGEQMENDTLEELYGLCRGKLRLHQGVAKVVINSSNEDLSLSIADEMPPRQDEVPQYSSRPSSAHALHSVSPRYGHFRNYAPPPPGCKRGHNYGKSFPSIF